MWRVRLKSSNALKQRFEIATFVDELWILLVEHLLQRLDLVDHHAEDRGDGALAWEVLCFCDPDLAAQQIDQVFGVALVQHGKVFLHAGLIGKLSQH